MFVPDYLEQEACDDSRLSFVLSSLRSAYFLSAVVLGMISMEPQVSTNPRSLNAASARVTVSRDVPTNSAI